MTTEIMIRFIEGRPFVPFEFHVVDGRVFRVPHSDYATSGRAALAVTIYDDAGMAEIVDVALITSLRPLEPLD